MDLIWKFTVLNLNFFRECIFLAIFLMYMLDCRCTQCWRESARGRESWNCLLVYTIHMQGIPIWCWSYLLGFYSLHLLYMCTFLHFVCIVSVFSSLFAYLLVFASMFVLKTAPVKTGLIVIVTVISCKCMWRSSNFWMPFSRISL